MKINKQIACKALDIIAGKRTYVELYVGTHRVQSCAAISANRTQQEREKAEHPSSAPSVARQVSRGRERCQRGIGGAEASHTYTSRPHSQTTAPLHLGVSLLLSLSHTSILPMSLCMHYSASVFLSPHPAFTHIYCPYQLIMPSTF